MFVVLICRGSKTDTDLKMYGGSIFLIIIIIYVMELGHLLTRSGLTYPEVSSKVCHNSFCQLENSVRIYYSLSYPTVTLTSWYTILTNEEMTTESQRYNCFIRNGGNAIPKHASPEAKGSNPTTGFTLFWARNLGKF
jgi:hypothetical protein